MKKTATIAVQVTPEVKKAIESHVRNESVRLDETLTVSAYIRSLIEQTIAEPVAKTA